MNGYDRCTQLLEAMRLLFPQLGLSFGYIGNCGVDRRGPFDERRWMFFTKVENPGDTFYHNAWHFEGSDTAGLDVFAAHAEAKLEQWLLERVLPSYNAQEAPRG